MHKLISDAWIREAEEASNLIEDLVNRVNHRRSSEEKEQGATVKYNFSNAKFKLSELGVKLDRLESLLLNPPPKPILTDEELEFRWKMLLDIQSRTRAFAHDLYALPSTKRLGSVTAGGKDAASITIGTSDQDNSNATSAKEESEQVTPLLVSCQNHEKVLHPAVSDNFLIYPNRDESLQSQMLGKFSISKSLRVCLWKALILIMAVLGATALLLFLFIICAII